MLRSLSSKFYSVMRDFWSVWWFSSPHREFSGTVKYKGQDSSFTSLSSLGLNSGSFYPISDMLTSSPDFTQSSTSSFCTLMHSIAIPCWSWTLSVSGSSETDLALSSIKPPSAKASLGNGFCGASSSQLYPTTVPRSLQKPVLYEYRSSS